MDKNEIEKVHEVIKERGDSFWNVEGNEELFDEVVSMLNEVGYDLKLVKVTSRR